MVVEEDDDDEDEEDDEALAEAASSTSASFDVFAIVIAQLSSEPQPACTRQVRLLVAFHAAPPSSSHRRAWRATTCCLAS